jgi:hypothetical protein
MKIHTPFPQKHHSTFHAVASSKLGFACLLGLVCTMSPFRASFAEELPAPVIELLADESNSIQNTGSLGEMLKAQKLEHEVNVSVQQLPLPGGKSISKTVAVAEKPASLCYSAKFPFEEISITPGNGGLTYAFWLNPAEELPEQYAGIYSCSMQVSGNWPGMVNQMQVDLRFKKSDDSESLVSVKSPKDFTIPTEWHFYTVVATVGDGVYFYRDGEEIAHVADGFPSDANFDNLNSKTKEVTLGGGHPKGDENPQNISRFSTAMVFDKTLSPEQVAKLYERQTTGKTK